MEKLVFLLSNVFAYDNSAGWKLDDDGNIVAKDGNPVYVDASGQEMVMQQDSISKLNAEAKQLREARDSAETKLKAFDGLDPKAAREAIEKLKDVDLSKMVDAGKLDEVKEEVKRQMQSLLDESNKQRDEALSERDTTKINAFFASNEFLRDSLAVPRDFVESAYRNNFKVENGEIVAYNNKGERIDSKENIGDYASPSEALKILIESRPDKDTILRADVGSGTGSDGAAGGRGKGRVMKRGDFEKLPPHKQAEISKKVGLGEMTLTD